MKRNIIAVWVGLLVLCLGLTARATQDMTSLPSLELNPESRLGQTYSLRANNTSGTRVFSLTPAGVAYFGGAVSFSSTLGITGLTTLGANGLAGAEGEIWTNPAGEWVLTGAGGLLGDRVLKIGVDHATAVTFDSDTDVFVLNGVDPLTFDTSGVNATITPTSGTTVHAGILSTTSLVATGASGVDAQAGPVTLRDDNSIDSLGGLLSLLGSGANALDLTIDLVGAAPGDPVVISSAGSLQLTFPLLMGFAGGEYLDCVSVDGTCALHGASGALGDKTISFVLDSAGNAGITTDTATLDLPTIAPTAITGTGVLGSAQITDIDRTVSIPLSAWRTDADPHLDIAAATTPNVSSEGNFDTIEWASGENAQKITYTFIVPNDYESGLALWLYGADDAAGDGGELWSVQWYSAVDGGADNPAANDECAAGCAKSDGETVELDVIALDAAAVTAGAIVRLVVGLHTNNETVHLVSSAIKYTAAQ